VVIGGAELAHQLGLGSGGHDVEYMHFQVALRAEQRGEQADRSRTGHQDALGLEPGPPANLLDLVPRLGDDAGRFHEYADLGQVRVEAHRVSSPRPASARWRIRRVP
jgi:hypothetical protein